MALTTLQLAPCPVSKRYPSTYRRKAKGLCLITVLTRNYKLLVWVGGRTVLKGDTIMIAPITS